MGKIVRAISADGSAFCAAIDSHDIVSEIFKLHNTTNVAGAALGRLATAASLMGSLMKNERDRLTLRVNGGGPGGSMVAVSDHYGNVKCYTENPQFSLPLNAKGKLDVGGYVGKNGFLSVIKDLGLKEPYATASPLITGEIGDDIASYYGMSEQIPTVCGLGVLVVPEQRVKAAGGFLIQLIPPINESALDLIEENIKTMSSVTALLSSGKTVQDIALDGLSGLEPQILDTFSAEYHCDCSRERTESVLISLGKSELEELSNPNGTPVEICCHFCNKKYHFSYNEIRDLLEGL